MCKAKIKDFGHSLSKDKGKVFVFFCPVPVPCQCRKMYFYKNQEENQETPILFPQSRVQK